jgi:hypothetical protein
MLVRLPIAAPRDRFPIGPARNWRGAKSRASRG